MFNDPAGLIVAMTGLIVGGGGLYLNFRGGRTSERQQVAADRALDAKNELDRQAQVVEQLSTHNDRLIVRAERAEAAAETRLEELDEQRTMARHQLAAQEARCRETQGALVETLVVLRSVVNDEIARSAADRALAAPPHPHELPGPQRPAPSIEE